MTHLRFCALLCALTTAGSLDAGSLFAQSSSIRARFAARATDKTASDPLRRQVEEAIEISKRRFLSGDKHSPWQVMHGLLALKYDFEVKVGDRKVNAIEWISAGQTYNGDPWFQKTEWGGRAHPYNQPYIFEGHANQFLAILSMADLPLEHEFKTGNGNETITVKDLVENAKMEIKAQDEPTWTLWALSHYLGPDAVWKNKHGEMWSIERLGRMQIYADVNSAACGGSHGLFALSRARNAYLADGRPLRGVWIEADQKIQQYITVARAYQNRDGSFSDSFFKGRSWAPDFEKRLGSSGHTVEMLMAALPDERLNEPWVRNGVEAVARDLIQNSRRSAKCGPLYHAVNGLTIYLKRTAPEEATPAGAEDSAEPAEKSRTEKESSNPPVEALNENDSESNVQPE